jgi:hypothetical protein
MGEVMSDNQVATTADGLSELSGYVHDEWFSLKAVEQSAGCDHVTIELVRGDVVRERLGWQSIEMGDDPAGTLIIRKVRGMKVYDEAQTGNYEVDYLTATENGAIVQLHATIPLRIDFRVDEIDVEFVPAPES